jgi:hypothetical protein
MRTLAFLLERLPGQRGGQYRLQPAHLGLRGREHDTGRLLYDKGSGAHSTQMHEAALTAFVDLRLTGSSVNRTIGFGLDNLIPSADSILSVVSAVCAGLEGCCGLLKPFFRFRTISPRIPSLVSLLNI